MSAPNAQPAGSRPAPGVVHEHDAFEDGTPSSSGRADLGKGLPAHGAPAPVGNGKANPLH